MGDTALRHPYLVAAKVAILLINYGPYLFFLQLGSPAVVMLGTGTMLIISLLLRDLVLGGRLPSGMRTAWILGDAIIWAAGMQLNGWDGNYAYLVIGADAAMAGWRHRSGLPGTLAVLAILLGARVIDWPGLRPYLSEYLFPIVVGLLLVQALVYLVSLIREQQEHTAKARTEALLANAHLREYSSQVEALAALRERTRIAREVHDVVAHAFTGMIMQLEAVRLLMEADPGRAAARLELVQQGARDSLDDLRRSVHALRPLPLDQGHGIEAVARLVEGSRTATGIDAVLSVAGPAAELTAAQELCIYRAVQEGLSNAIRHGRANQVRVSLLFRSGEVSLTITDNGRGLLASEGGGAAGAGLLGIRERVAVLGGRVETQASGQGFQLSISFPLTLAC